ncbi:bifunctional protein-disulfide isomerase/oxidoreductase DsbC [Vibrio hippocampi]|uniref:Thiol:disulfide interchange protein n=1 Tax=Vibrio hippocampi TaxID=654686 RepID=A0ABM8ZK54_9VIBR|nr:bifunctional protein-disulfide isomerase/oxidoreductase DsbC [Vibrio hippocampi]CAH0526807.1 Thiol:disulfide interchange protein DsbC [Vibrio hippocampi]
MSVLRKLTLLTLPLFAVACGAEEPSTPKTTESAQVETAVVAQDDAALKARFAKIGIDVLEVVPTDIEGLHEVRTNSGVLYSSATGDYFIAGTMYSLNENGQYVDLLAARQAPINAEKIAQLRDSMIEYKADNEKYAVTVFTDITCGYCVKLHKEMKQYNDLGITVRYLAYPRQGPSGPVAEQMAKIWCSTNPNEAMHDAKENRIEATFDGDLTQCRHTIAQHFALGRDLGISGTPAIFLPNGELVSGYLPAKDLLSRLEQTQ